MCPPHSNQSSQPSTISWHNSSNMLIISKCNRIQWHHKDSFHKQRRIASRLLTLPSEHSNNNNYIQRNHNRLIRHSMWLNIHFSLNSWRKGRMPTRHICKRKNKICFSTDFRMRIWWSIQYATQWCRSRPTQSRRENMIMRREGQMLDIHHRIIFDNSFKFHWITNCLILNN